MECSLGKTNMLSDSQEIASLLRNPKVHYCVYKRPLLFPFLNQISPVLAFLFYSQLCFGLPSGLFPARYPIKIPYALLFCTCHMP